MIEFVIPGQPKPQGRPRFFRRGKFVGTYDPKDSATFKDKVAHYARLAGVKPLVGPVNVGMKFIFQRTQAMMKKKWPDGLLPCSKRPDMDNCMKSVMDGLIAIAWIDDSQIVNANVQKLYSEKAGTARTEIWIEEMK